MVAGLKPTTAHATMLASSAPISSRVDGRNADQPHLPWFPQLIASSEDYLIVRYLLFFAIAGERLIVIFLSSYLGNKLSR